MFSKPSKAAFRVVVLVVFALAACDSSTSPSSSSQTTPTDVETLDDSAQNDTATPPSDSALEDTFPAEDSAPDDAPDDVPEPDSTLQPRVFESRLPNTQELGTRRGLRVVRGLIHNHSIHSHDACDGQPRLADGSYNEPCNQDWRRGVCETRQDFAFNTDHEGLAAFVDFEELLLLRGDDEVVLDAQNNPIANRMRCDGDDAIRPLILPGGEFGVMPVGLNRHLEAESADDLDRMYDEITPERIASFKELGAVVFQAHTESRTVEELRPLGLDGFEIYNLHANIAPDIREDWLGLEPFGYADDIAPFIERGGPVADLTFLGFFTANVPALKAFDTLLAEGQHLVGIAGSDSHQNSLPFALADGERADSFRRMMRFFSNHVLIPEGELTPEILKDALRQGRTYVAFETLGTPLGFDYYAETSTGTTFEMGDQVALKDAPTLHITAPTVLGEPSTNLTTITLLRAEPGGAVKVANGATELRYTPTEPGAYRVEITSVPRHLEPFLTGTDLHEREFVWIYANPIYVQ